MLHMADAEHGRCCTWPMLHMAGAAWVSQPDITLLRCVHVRHSECTFSPKHTFSFFSPKIAVGPNCTALLSHVSQQPANPAVVSNECRRHPDGLDSPWGNGAIEYHRPIAWGSSQLKGGWGCGPLIAPRAMKRRMVLTVSDSRSRLKPTGH